MQYEYSLIHITDDLGRGGDMYSLSLADARDLSFVLNGKSVTLIGKYLFCFSDTDKIINVSGVYSLKSINFLPYFYNVNLNTAIIDAPIYEEMREKYGYPDFYLFRKRTDRYNGIIKLSDSEYESIFTLFSAAERHINGHPSDVMWSCRTRSDIISVLRMAEAAHLGKHTDVTNEVLRYIRANPAADLSLSALCKKFSTNRTTLANTIKELTGLAPGQYVLSERLGQTRPELLFTAIPVNEIAEKYGFKDLNYYIRAFKKKYGTTPLQYRKNGFEKRISEEKKYHLKNGGAGLMSVDEFMDYLKRGLGLAVMRLRREPDKSRFREAFKTYILNARGYRDAFHTFEYEEEILSCFDDANGIKEEIISYFTSSAVSLKPYHVKLLKRWFAPERIISLKESLGTAYENAYRRVYEAAKKVDCDLYTLFDKPGLIDEKITAAANDQRVCDLNEIYLFEYFEAFDALVAFGDTPDTVIKLIDKEFEMRRETGYVPSAPAYDIFFGLRHDRDVKIKEYVRRLLPGDYELKYDIRPAPYLHLRPSKIEALDAGYFLNNKEFIPSDVLAEVFCSEYLPPKTVSDVLTEISETNDRQKCLELMSLFTTPDVQRGTEPLNTVKLLPELKAAVEKDPDSIESRILAFVLRCRADEIKEYAAELISKNVLIGEAVESYFYYNYCDNDRESFAEKLSNTDKRDVAYFNTFCKGIKNCVKGLPTEMAHFIFRNCANAHARAYFIKVLYEGGVYDERIIEEALYDSVPRTRKYASLMRDKIPYVEIKRLNALTAGDCVEIFADIEKGSSTFGIQLENHLTENEYKEYLLDPLKNGLFYNKGQLSAAARIGLIRQKRITGFVAYINKKPVGFIDCGKRELYTKLNESADERDNDGFVMLEPVTRGDTRVAKALVDRAVKHARDDRAPVAETCTNGRGDIIRFGL